MDKHSEFISGLQIILDSPNPPHDELLRVISSTRRDFLSQALSQSTLLWPTRTHLELVKIVINQPIPQPPHNVVTSEPVQSHEEEPFFGAAYFEQLHEQLLAMSAQQLSESSGAWVCNIGFSIEATLMQALRRMDVLEASEPDGRVRAYNAHVLGSGTLHANVWRALARVVFAMFYVLPCSTRVPWGTSGELHAASAQLVGHYGSWLQIVQQIIENHGAALCRRIPTVVEDPATRQFRWGIPSVHAVAATEVLRNILVRRTLLRHTPQFSAIDVPAWANSAHSVALEEQRLEALEQAVLGTVISKDPSAVYGMMSEHHCLLQVSHTLAHAPTHAKTIVGTPSSRLECMEWTCYGLAPILGYEGYALMQAVSMDKLIACLRDMKQTTLDMYSTPMYGRYPKNGQSVPAYMENLLLRMATTLLNTDWAWTDACDMLAPNRIEGVSQESVVRMARMLRLTAVYFDACSLGTTWMVQGRNAVETATGQLLRRSFMAQPCSDDLSRILSDDAAPSSGSTHVELVGLAVESLVEFVQSAQAMELLPALELRDQCAAALKRVLLAWLNSDKLSSVVAILGHITFATWQALGRAKFGTNGVSLVSVVYAGAQSLRVSDEIKNVLNENNWQRTISMCCPDGPRLAYIILVRCLLPGFGMADEPAATLSRRGIKVLRSLERVMSTDGMSEWEDGVLLFVPPIYAGAEGQEAAQFAQQHLGEALRILAMSTLDEWKQQLGIKDLGAAGDYMRQVAMFVTDYVHRAGDMLTLLPRLLGASTNTANAFMAPNVLAKLPPIETQGSVCDVSSVVRQWRRAAAQSGFAQSGANVQELVARCYPSNARHYLDAVVVQFMEAEPAVGVELVVGSVADYMWKNQIVYSRRAAPFYAIRAMFVVAGSTRSESLLSTARTESLASTARTESLASTTRAESLTEAEEPEGAESDDETVRSPIACLRILQLLTALRYGNSMRDTPIHMWLTDCLDAAPVCVQREYFERAMGSPPPAFSAELPVEPDWPRKIRAAMALWAGDRRLRSRPLVASAAAAVLRHVLDNNGSDWATRWAEWSQVLGDVVKAMFARPNAGPTQREIVQLVLATPIDAGAALSSHPLSLLGSSDESDHALAFADSRDWFLAHVLGELLDAVQTGTESQRILDAVLMGPDSLYSIVPWLDVAASLVQNVPLGNGCPVAMDSATAKANFVGYLSPLARVLFAISEFAEASGNEPGSDFDWTWLELRLNSYIAGCEGETLADTVDALLDAYTYSSVRGLRSAICAALAASGARDNNVLRVTVEQAFGARPLDVYTLHSMRPRNLTSLEPLTPTDTTENAFRPGAELYPLARHMLVLACEQLGSSCVASLIEAQMWTVGEEPDVRRSLIALKPRLIPKEQRPAATTRNVTLETVAMTTSASLHIAAEATASRAAYALDRSVYVLGLIAARVDGLVDMVHKLACSRILLAVLMVAVGDSMRQFATLAATRELLCALWTNDEGVARVWAGVNFYALAQRLNSQLPEEFTTWADVQAISLK
ncbi:hypothetical protein GGH96_002090 [Coemansia sp. RSA 1972]|nr:hypothetical protein GGH96_002090 [Coemansia sp. RSA 1972]